MFGTFKITRAEIVKVTTSASFKPLGNVQGAIALDIVNNTEKVIEYRRKGGINTIAIPSGATRLVLGVSDASQIEVKASDGSEVSVTAEVFIA